MKKLLDFGEDYHNNACMNYDTNTKSQYIRGYRLAADTLIEQINKDGANDTLVFPIIFLYRHHIELLLKNIIDSSNILLENSPKPKEGHKIEDLWNDAKGLIRKVFKTPKNNEPKEFEIVTQVILQLAQIDPDSTSFRYAFEKNGKKNLSELNYVNFRNFREVIEPACQFLDGIDNCIGEYIDSRK